MSKSKSPGAAVSTGFLPKKYFSKYKKPLVEFPNLIQHQIDSYNWLIEKGLKETFKEFTPIQDYSGKKFQLQSILKKSESPFDLKDESQWQEVTIEARALPFRKMTVRKILRQITL
jgi:DNA-directed RNA polymerase subunit beta